MKQKKHEFPSEIKRNVRKRANNRCERCGIDFDEDFMGEFHHIIPIVYGGENNEKNCSLLCHNCHLAAPNVKSDEDLLIYNFFIK